MARRGLQTVPILLAVAGCSGTYQPTGDPPDLEAREAFAATVFPLYHGECGARCHENGGEGALIFGDSYDDLATYGGGRLWNCDPPSSSLWVTQGEHPPGVAWQPTSKTTVTEWITLWASVSPRCMP
jgi:hypothetical protein